MRKKLYPTNNKKTKNDCPNCGWKIERSHTFESVLAGNFSNERNGSYDAYRTTPTRAATLQADVLVPLAQSLVGATLATIPAIVVAQIARWEWYSPLAVGSVTILVQWFSIVKKLEGERSVTEQFSYQPDPENCQAQPLSNKPDGIQLEVISKDDDFKASMKIITLPRSVTAEQFVSFCRDILVGKSLARRNWEGSGKPFSRDSYDDLVAAMQTAGLVMTVQGKGKQLTKGGKRAIARMVRERRISG